MDSWTPNLEPPAVTVRPVDGSNWRDVADLQVADWQREFVEEPCFYLALCCYGGVWHPLAVSVGGRVIGFMMWGVDPADQHCWLGGFLIDQRVQRRGYGRQALQAAISLLVEEQGHRKFALSYCPHNGAQHLYHELGFTETTEWEDNEVVARLSLPAGAEGPLPAWLRRRGVAAEPAPEA